MRKLKNNHICYQKRRRHALLMEILIAFSLVLMCAFPLLYPHFAMLKAEKEAIHTIELDRLVGFVYSDLIIKLYRNQIPWKEICQQDNTPSQPQDIDAKFQDNPSLLQKLRETGYTGTYQLEQIEQCPKYKKKQNFRISHHLLKVIFSFKPSSKPTAKPIEFERHIYIKHEVDVTDLFNLNQTSEDTDDDDKG
jgi:hypothetical protein